MLSIRREEEDTNKLRLVGDGGGRGRTRREAMEKRELEEQESYIGQDDDVDPDALSYIDEKIQHVLGHFQKEFQGGVSAETLGAQFGGYGSFLPSFQRSPSISSQPKSPVKMHNILSRTLYNSQPKGGHPTPSLTGTTSITRVSTALTGKLTEMPDKMKASIDTHGAEGIPPSLSKPVNACDQKMLKLRINVGLDNGLARNKPAIYSDLGLDISPSPSSSPEDTPDGSEECSRDSAVAFRESPTTILQIMTCLPAPGGFLSPLPDSLLLSYGKDDILLTKFKPGILHKGQTETCSASSVTSLNIKSIKSSTYKKSKSREKSQMIKKADDLPDMCDEVEILKKEAEAETPIALSITTAPRDMSRTSCSRLEGTREKRQMISDSENENLKDPGNASLKERVPVSDVSKNTLVNINSKLNFKLTSATKPLDERIGNSQLTSYAKAALGCKAIKNYDTTMEVSNCYGGRKNISTDTKEPLNNSSVQKACSSEKDILMATQEIDTAFGGSRLKGNPSNERLFAESSKESLSIMTSVASKRKNEMSKTPKLYKKDNNNKAIDSHNGSSRLIEKSKEKPQLNKVDNLQIVNLVTDALGVAPLTYNSTNLDAPATISDAVIGELWVFCDLCQKWRLLPYGTNPDILPKEWQCSMQVWLPGLNKCYISEDETTKAFHELYQVPAPANVKNLADHPDTAMSSITRNGTLENFYSAPVENKKHGMINSSNLLNGSSLSYFSNSGKNIQPSSGNKSFKNDTKSLNHRTIGQIGRLVNHTMEKYNHKVEKTSKIPASCQNEGVLFENCEQQLMSKGKRKVDPEGHTSSKRNKKDSSHHYDKDLHIEDPTAAKKVLQISGNQSHYAPKSFKTIPAPVKIPKEHVGAFSSGNHKKHFSSSDTENPGKFDSINKKRVFKELQESGTHYKNSITIKQISNNRPVIRNGLSDSELRRQKKAKIAQSEGQDSNAVIADEKVNKEGCLTRVKSSSKDCQSHNDDEERIHASECVNAIKRDVTNVHPVTAATSSSSMVTGSQKNAVKLQEARGSPLESVSSSPMRILNAQSNFRYLLAKDDILNVSPLKRSPKSSSDGDVEGNSEQSRTTKDPSSKSHIRVSKACKIAEPGDLPSFCVSNDYQGREAFSVGKMKRGTHNSVLSSNFCEANSCSKNSTNFRDSKIDRTFGTKKHKPSFLDSNSDCKEFDHLHQNKEHNLNYYSKQHKVHDSREIFSGSSKTKFISQENLHLESSHQRQDHSSQMVVDILEGSSKKVIQTSHNVKEKREQNGLGSQSSPKPIKEINSEQYHLDAVNGGASKFAKQLRKSQDLKGFHSNSFLQPSATQCSPMKNNGLATVNEFIQEARELKHTADHLKNEGSEQKSSGVFFEASLKFLHVASLMESSNTEIARQVELFPSVKMLHMYLETALLCEFSAREYENLKEMAAAALAYKCAEVAYMKVAYFKHPNACKDRHDLQTELDAALPEESPSSSASDVDNLNNQGDFEKTASATATGSTQTAGNFVISAQSHHHVKRLLTYTNHLNCAFEASKKSRNAIAVASTDRNKYDVKVLNSVKKVLDFSFNNVEGLLQLIRTALNSISSKV